MQAFARILVPVDGSEHSDRAVKKAAVIAQLCQSDLDLLYVSYLDGDTDARVEAISWLPDAVAGSVTRVSKAILEHARAQVPPAVSLQMHTETGTPAKAILAFAKAHDCDLIVVGGRGLGIMEGLLLGSVSQYLVEHAKCPVLVVK